MAVIEAIATTYLEADVASVTFSGIPTTYEHLQLRISGKEDYASAGGALGMRFNGDTGSNYTYHSMQGSSSTPLGRSSVNQSAIWMYWFATLGNDAANYADFVVNILDYRNANKTTTIQFVQGLAVSRGTPYTAFESGM